MNSEQLIQKPDIKLSVKQTFGFDSDMKVGAFSKKNDYVPKIDPDYKFDKDTTLAILAGFSFNKKFNLLVVHIFKIIPIFVENFNMLKTEQSIFFAIIFF